MNNNQILKKNYPITATNTYFKDIIKDCMDEARKDGRANCIAELETMLKYNKFINSKVVGTELYVYRAEALQHAIHKLKEAETVRLPPLPKGRGFRRVF
jgi:hypothetical protein